MMRSLFSSRTKGRKLGRALVPRIRSAESYYLHIHGEQKGPYTIPQITHLYRTGLIAPETLFWEEAMDQWQPVTELWREPEKSWHRQRLPRFGAIIVAAAVGVYVGLEFFSDDLARIWVESGAESIARKIIYILFFRAP